MKKIKSIYDLINMTPNSWLSAEILLYCEEQGKMNKLWDYIIDNIPHYKMVDILVDDFLASCREELWEVLES